MVGLISAQDDMPLPVLHAEDIFAEGVTTLERLPVLNFNNEARLLYYFNVETEVWETYPYPDEIENLQSHPWYRDNFIVITEQTSTRNIKWNFYPDIGNMERQNPDDVIYCGEYAAPGRSQIWDFVEVAPDDYRLCNLETGELSTYPGQNFREWLVDFIGDAVIPCIDAWNPRVSPNGEYIVFHDCIEYWNRRNSALSHTFVSYHVPTGEWLYLGHTEYGQDIMSFPFSEVLEWISDTELIFLLQSHNPRHYEIAHILDVTQPSPMLEILAETDQSINYFEENRQLAWLEENLYSQTYDIHLLDVDTGETRIIDDKRCRLMHKCIVSYIGEKYLALRHFSGHRHTATTVYSLIDNTLLFDDAEAHTIISENEFFLTRHNEDYILQTDLITLNDNESITQTPVTTHAGIETYILYLPPNRRYALSRDGFVYDLQNRVSFNIAPFVQNNDGMEIVFNSGWGDENHVVFEVFDRGQNRWVHGRWHVSLDNFPLAE